MIDKISKVAKCLTCVIGAFSASYGLMKTMQKDELKKMKGRARSDLADNPDLLKVVEKIETADGMKYFMNKHGIKS